MKKPAQYTIRTLLWLVVAASIVFKLLRSGPAAKSVLVVASIYAAISLWLFTWARRMYGNAGYDGADQTVPAAAIALIGSMMLLVLVVIALAFSGTQ